MTTRLKSLPYYHQFCGTELRTFHYPCLQKLVQVNIGFIRRNIFAVPVQKRIFEVPRKFFANFRAATVVHCLTNFGSHCIGNDVS